MDDIKGTEAADSNPQSKPIIFTMKGGTAAAAAADTPSFNNNNNITTTSDQTTTSTSSWGTWEELLLACAVKRHGVHDWDTVAMELQAKTSLPPLLTTASNCNLKYLDLRRRFHSRHQNDDVPPDADDVHHDPHNNNSTTNIPWLDDLRKLRVAQLRQELHGYDVSIVSLQLKVKRLEQEREESFKDDDPKPDLEEEQQQDSNRHRSENDKTVRGKPDGSNSKPDHENQSANGSNSTCSKNLDYDNKPGPGDRVLSEPGPLSAGSDEPSKKTGSGQSDSDSDKGSSETVAKKRRERGRQGKGGGDSAGELRESSEAQSSVSLTKKRNGKRHRRMEVPEQQQHNNEDVSLVKSEPLIEVLQLIRAQEHGSLFERRLSAQESDKYKSIVQQHVDLETIQSKLRKESYSSCSLSFYRDLLLLFNNAVVFFPKSSLHSRTAHQLRRLVLNEMKKKNLITRPNHDPAPEPSDSVVPAPATSQQPKRPDQLERSDSLLAKQKSTAPIIVCRKRSSISSKPSAAASSFGQTLKGDDNKKPAAFDLKSSIKNSKASSDDHAAAEEHGGSVVVKSAAAAAKAKDNPVITGTRGSRRTSTSVAHHENNTSASKKKQSASPASLKAETPKADKKGKMEAAGSDKKRSAAADFLKRIKRNSPADTLKSGGTGTGTSSRSGGEQKRRGGIGKADKVKERVSRQSGHKKKQAKEESSSPSRRSVGRPPKKAAAEAANAVASPKRARESGGKQEASRRPKKRSRR